MSKKTAPRSQAAGVVISHPPPTSALWLLSAGSSGELSPLLSGGLRQVCCGQGYLALLQGEGRVAIQDTQQDAGTQTGKRKCFTIKKLKVNSLDCGGSHMVLLSVEGKLYDYYYLAGSLQTSQVQGLHDRQIIQVACGDHHSMALSKGGELFTWGENMHGQLGLGSLQSRQSTPQQVDHLRGCPLAQITAGSAHSFALSLSGTVYSWGNNNAGQLGLGHMENQYWPAVVKFLTHKRIESVSCGEEHTAVLSKDGLVFTFGAGGHGQLGHTCTRNELHPRLVAKLRKVHVSQVACGRHHTLACIPSLRALYFLGVGEKGQLDNGDTYEQLIKLPMELPEYSVHEGNSCSEDNYRVVAGGNQTVVFTLDEKHGDRGMSRRIAIVEADMAEKWLENGNSDHWRKTKKEIKQIFSSVACVNGAFLEQRDKQCRTSSDMSGVDMLAASLFFEKISNSRQVLQQVNSCLKKFLIPELSHLPPHRDALAIFLLLPECSMMHETQDSVPLVAAFAHAVNSLRRPSLKILGKWWSSLQAPFLNKQVHMLKRAVVNKPMSGHVTQQDHRNTTAILQMLEKLYKANRKANYALQIEEFYIPEICQFVDLFEDVERWQVLQRMPESNEAEEPVIFCQFPFTLNLLAKRQVLKIDLALKQEVTKVEASTQWFKNWMQGSNESLKLPIFHLKVNNHNMVEDTLHVLSTMEDCDLKKQLVVEFSGLLPFDQGNLKRVLFVHVFEEMLQPEYGMFVQCAKLSPLWFPASPLVETKKYYLFGILCGLTIFNCPSVYLPFPLALFKKLLDKHPTLADLTELDPVAGRSLQYVLDYEHDDIEENLDICFIASWDNKTEDLIPNGSDTAVDNTNKHDYVNKYVDYVFNKSVAEVFEEFKRGFYKVCDREILKHFEPQELVGVMVGNEEFDWNKFEQIAEYDGVYKQHPPHPTIQMFWEVFHELPLSEKKNFLLFVIGSDSIPVYGMDCLKIRIASSPIFTEEHLPQTQTCYQILLLPQYSIKQVLKEKLMLAICHNKGFG